MEMVNSRELSPSIRMVFCPFGEQWGSRGLFIARISARILMENYIRMRTPAEGFIGSHQNFPPWLCPRLGLFPWFFPWFLHKKSCGTAAGVVQKELSPLQVFQDTDSRAVKEMTARIR